MDGRMQTKRHGAAPKRHERVPRTTVACPDCMAQIGEQCKTGTGKTTKTHSSRVRLTTRAYNDGRKAPPPRAALTITGTRKHALAVTEPGKLITMCGRKVSYTRAMSTGGLRAGTSADVHCKECLQALANTRKAG